MTAKASLTMQLPKLDDLTKLIRTEVDGESEVRGLDEFREEFRSLVGSEELKHVRRVVILVDDLDRCLPETVIETLEAIRLFLAVPKMSFVLAADEDKVADAIRTKYPRDDASKDPTQEEPAKLYLHKILQTTIPLPTLSHFDTQAYLFLLQLGNRAVSIDNEHMESFIIQCGDLRKKGGTLDALTQVADLDVSEELKFSARLTPMLYEKMHGNPRRIKRFLNDIYVRQSIASRRGIDLELPVIAKLMVLESLLVTEFETMLAWLAHGDLRERMKALETAAGRTTHEPVSEELTVASDNTSSESDFSPEFIRWARLYPEIGDTDLSPYLHLAAAFTGMQVLDLDLPQQLRDIASNLLSAVRAEQRAVTNDELSSLSTNDNGLLINHLGRMARDRPTSQRQAVDAMLRLGALHADQVSAINDALKMIPADDLELASVLLFQMPQHSRHRSVIQKWHGAATKPHIKNALSAKLSEAQ